MLMKNRDRDAAEIHRLNRLFDDKCLEYRMLEAHCECIEAELNATKKGIK